MEIKLSSIRKMHRSSLILIAVVVLFVVSMLAVPASSISPNQCSSYHGSRYNQQLDIVEGNSQNSLPTTIQVGQTVAVTVAVANINNAPRYNQLSSVSVTLQSKNSHFSVSSPTYLIGYLGSGSTTATWQITGISLGQDELVISASARNSHPENEGISPFTLTDNYSPNPIITVTNTSPTPTSTITPTQNPTPTVPPPSESPPTTTPTPSPPPTSLPTSNPTVAPSNVSPKPTSSSSPTPTATPAVENTTNPIPNATNETTISQSANEFSSSMLYIHPPLAIAGYVFTFLFAAILIKSSGVAVKPTKFMGITAWLLVTLGLFTGMIWAQVVIGSYWTWDPKEISTLALFLTLSIGQVAYFEQKQKLAKLSLGVSCVLVIITIFSSIIVNSFL